MAAVDRRERTARQCRDARMTDEQVFQEAIKLHLKDRMGFVRQNCTDLGQRDRVSALLAAHQKNDSLLDTDAMAGETKAEGTRTLPQQIGDFEILRELGRGGMGVVYEARQKSLKRKVALKVLSSGLGLSSKAILRFRREAEAAGKLHHTNIVPIYTTGEDRGIHYYAMELIDGPSLDAVVRDLKVAQGGNGSPKAIRLAMRYRPGSAKRPCTIQSRRSLRDRGGPAQTTFAERTATFNHQTLRLHRPQLSSQLALRNCNPARPLRAVPVTSTPLPR